MVDFELLSGIGYILIEFWLKVNFDFCLVCIVINFFYNCVVFNELININIVLFKKYNLDY